MVGWLATPKAFAAGLTDLTAKVMAKPDQTAALDAQTFLTNAQLRLSDYREAMRKNKAAEIAYAAAKAAYETYCTVLEEELNALYDSVEKDFSAFYRAINEDDEAKFTAKLTPSDVEAEYRRQYGDMYKAAVARVRAAKGKPITSLFELPKSGRVKTEILFIERCLALLKPGGRLGIVLPEGVYNNPSLSYVREYVEDRAFLRAVVSLPAETFNSAGASVKASLLFLQKFTDREQAEFNRKKKVARAEVESRYRDEMRARTGALEAQIQAETDRRRRGALVQSLKEYRAGMEARISRESRGLLRERFPYPVFLYDAKKVGITATGEADENELYPNPSVPPGVEKTALDLYREFRRQPASVTGSGSRR
jgi:hypothetical protein